MTERKTERRGAEISCALIPCDQKLQVRECFFYILYFMHMNAVWQAYMCVLLTFTENFAPLL